MWKTIHMGGICNRLPWAILRQKNDMTGFHTEGGGEWGEGTGIPTPPPPPHKFENYDVIIAFNSYSRVYNTIKKYSIIIGLMYYS